MQHDFDARAELKWHLHEEDAPEDWSNAIPFASLRQALDAIVNGTPQTGHPWIRSGESVFAPHEVEDLWREDRMM